MSVTLAIESTHSALTYYSVAALSYLSVLLLLGYYSRTCILTPNKDKKIFILLGVIILAFVAAIILVGMMIMSGYEAHLARQLSIAEQAIDSAWGGALGVFLVGFAGWQVPVLVNYYYFKRELMLEANLQARQHFYATNRSWLVIRLGCIFIIVGFIFLALFIDQLFVKYTNWSTLWKTISALIELVVVIVGGIIGWRLLQSNDWVFWWKPQLAKSVRKTRGNESQ
ncbi:hypothetical protein [Schleiferilactobacillus perolens]|uniref:Uncharacterized protein n=1 Tax=Schleiferilactobacillus perolens DSM 12744 TaxID=1423792 RepID=A0A0R1MLK4_9LACO|nr:hypothetical protein [Schleiferilactobacillus perolens]KRL08782.1 hypothetical protein FD09_GL001155 [Schleiferilactobacillus perolens DSM 12744]